VEIEGWVINFPSLKIRVDHENFKDALREVSRLKSAFININSKFHGTETCIGKV
jgi:hypothetical protein